MQRQSAGVVTIQVQQIENIDPYRDFTTEFFGWMPDLHALLKPREAGHVAVEGDDFAVHSEAFCFLIPERPQQLRILVIEFLLIARQELDVAP